MVCSRRGFALITVVMLCLQSTLVIIRGGPLCYTLSGAGGIRTLVQTVKPYAFYMLIPAFDFRVLPRPGPPSDTLVPKVSFVM